MPAKEPGASAGFLVAQASPPHHNADKDWRMRRSRCEQKANRGPLDNGARALLSTVVWMTSALGGCSSSLPASGSGGIAGRDAGMLTTGGSPAQGGAGGVGGTGAGGIGAGGQAAGGSGTGGPATGGSGGGRDARLSDARVVDAGTVDAPPSDTPNAACSAITDPALCDRRSDCHAVFVDQGGCDCMTPGCCTLFQRCTDGSSADCTGPALCEMATPRCESPYTVGYANNCYEGCVRLSSCKTPTCPSARPAPGGSCGEVALTCLFEDCAGVGRSYATCTGGKWSVETIACTSVICGTSTSTGLTCALGQVCLHQITIGGAKMETATCVPTSCGTGPISPSCVPSAVGTCTTNLSKNGAVLECTYNACDPGVGGCA